MGAETKHDKVTGETTLLVKGTAHHEFCSFEKLPEVQKFLLPELPLAG